MPGIQNRLFNVVALVKTRIIHHHHAVFRGFRQQILLDQRQKHVGIDRATEPAGGEQTRAQQSPNGIGPAFRVPVLFAKATLANRRMAVRARLVARKTAFVNLDDGLVGFSIILQLIFKLFL